MSPVFALKNFLEGTRFFVKGCYWLFIHPKYLLMLLLPMALALGCVFFGLKFVFSYADFWIIKIFSFYQSDGWWWSSVFFVLKVIYYSLCIIFGVFFYTLIVGIIASPVYDHISAVIEKEILGRSINSLSFLASLKLIKEELKKVLFIFVISVVLFLVPGLNLLSPLITAFFVGWEFYDYPLARRGWGFRKRLIYVLGNFWSITGLGCIVLIPIFLMPLAVVGGTMLALEHMKNKKIGGESL